MEAVETFLCGDCSHEWGREHASFDIPTCPKCNEFLDVVETTKVMQDTKFVGGPVTINIPPIEEWTITSLKYACKNHKVKGYTKMSREQLVEAVKGVLAKK